MRILVLGNGVVGTTSAWYLTLAGHDVVVVDANALPASETSYANAGQLSFGHASPWAAPGVPLKALQWLFWRHSPLSIVPSLNPLQYRWLWGMWRNCSARHYKINKERMVRLAQHSSHCLAELRKHTGICYEGRQLGTLQLFRTQQQLDAAAHDVAVLAEHQVPYALLDRKGIAAYEPALASAPVELAGALRTLDDETGDCRLFTRQLAALAAQRGVEFRTGVVERLERNADRLAAVRINGQEERADAYVVALGSWSPQLLAPLGLKLPIYPLKGYSLTVPMTNQAMSPASTVLDETYKVTITRFDDRIRVGGMAEVAGFNRRLRPKRRATLERVMNQLYPQGGDLARAEFWCGLRPAVPDGTPIIGATPLRNLYLNTGHGTLGWTMACGSGQYLADLIDGKTPQIDPEGMDIFRYGAAALGPSAAT